MTRASPIDWTALTDISARQNTRRPAAGERPACQSSSTCHFKGKADERVNSAFRYVKTTSAPVLSTFSECQPDWRIVASVGPDAPALRNRYCCRHGVVLCKVAGAQTARQLDQHAQRGRDSDHLNPANLGV